MPKNGQILWQDICVILFLLLCVSILFLFLSLYLFLFCSVSSSVSVSTLLSNVSLSSLYITQYLRPLGHQAFIIFFCLFFFLDLFFFLCFCFCYLELVVPLSFFFCSLVKVFQGICTTRWENMFFFLFSSLTFENESVTRPNLSNSLKC